MRDPRYFGQCGRREWHASILADQTGNVTTRPAFKNGDVLSFIDARPKVSCQLRRERVLGVSISSTMARFSSYADRKLLTPAMIARIETHFHLPAERTEVTSDLNYQSKETHVLRSPAYPHRKVRNGDQFHAPEHE